MVLEVVCEVVLVLVELRELLLLLVLLRVLVVVVVVVGNPAGNPSDSRLPAPPWPWRCHLVVFGTAGFWHTCMRNSPHVHICRHA